MVTNIPCLNDNEWAYEARDMSYLYYYTDLCERVHAYKMYLWLHKLSTAVLKIIAHQKF